MHGLDVRDIEAFLGIVDHGGFRAAAQALYISQPALSRRIRNLEEALGVTLLERGAGGTRLSGHGRTFLESARQVDVAVRSAIDRTRSSGTQHLRFGATLGALGYLAPFLSDWATTHPRTRISVISDGVISLRSRLRDGGCDVAIISGNVGEEFPSLPFGHVETVAILPPGHRLAGSDDDLPIAALQGERIMVNGPLYLSSLIFLTACTLEGVETDVILESPVGPVLAAHAEAGRGIAICGDRTEMRGFDLPCRRLVDVRGEPLRFDLSVCWNEREEPSTELLAFATALAEFRPSFSARERRPG